MADKYYLTDREFNLEIEKGGIVSLKNMGDQGLAQDAESAEYVLPGTVFGEAVLTYYAEDNRICQWFINRSENYKDSDPKHIRNVMSYEGSTEDENGLLSVKVRMELKSGILEQIYTVRNISDEKVTVADAAFALIPNSEFNWGDKAGSKVIGHPYVGGNGSHSLITRCDGNGNYLLVMPYRGGKWEFFDQGADLPQSEETKKQRCRLYVYEHSTYSSGKAEEHGFRLRHPSTDRVLLPDEEMTIGLAYAWAKSYKSARECYMAYGIPDVITIPGYTVCRNRKVKMLVRGKQESYKLIPSNEDRTTVKVVSEEKSEINSCIYEITFDRLGENTIKICYGDGLYMDVEFFVTESIGTMISKRGRFIASHQVRDKSLWYDGLLTEWNNKTAVTLGPDNYDTIKGWRIYEVTCDDPGLSKPAFLSGKLAEYPVQEEIDALDYYIENFVWGGLQCTEEEDYPYGIYGIPDWYQNRNSKNPGNAGKEHLWRIYDYPHLMLMYYNMYRIAGNYKVKTKLEAAEYLHRAYKTAEALYTIPIELEQWSPYETGLYNELVIEDIISALEKEGLQKEADHLKRFWDRKIKYFVSKSKDLFGSEYPFDTTGFESTHALAVTALKKAEVKQRESRFDPPMTYRDAVKFMENQTACNIACRGYLEPAYYWYGSDYRANNHHYTLSYMSQMGGSSLLDYALNYSDDPYSLLRLAYGSMQSSWALLNSGDEESNYGYNFPGKEHDGAASGGFEPLPYGFTWLEQPHSFGAWYYSCEIDLGFCGALRGAATVLAKDPVFGLTLYGGTLETDKDRYIIRQEDGVGRRFHIITPQNRLHVTLDKGHFAGDISVKQDYSECEFCIDAGLLKEDSEICFNMETTEESGYSIYNCERMIGETDENGCAEIVLRADSKSLSIKLIKRG